MSFIIKGLKVFFVGLLSMLTVLLLCLFLIASLDIRSLLTRTVGLITDYELQIDEPVYVDLLPDLKLQIKNLTLDDQAIDSPKNFIEIGDFYLSMSTKHLLLEHEYIVDMEFNNIDLNIQMRPDEITNLDQLLTINSNIIGRITGHVMLNGQGENIDSFTRGLNGFADLKLDDGRWLDDDIWQQLRTARSIYKREDSPERTINKTSNIFSIETIGSINDGVFKSQDFVMKLPFTLITGRGDVSLVDGSFDYSVRAKLNEDLNSVLDLSDDELLDFSNGSIPIRVRGGDGSVSFRPDIEEIFRDEVESTFKDQSDRIKNAIKNHLLN